MSINISFTTKFRLYLGMFDPPENQPYANIGTDQINTPDHQALALQAARESIVLLQNDGALPLNMSKKVALIGPNANATSTMQGNYHGTAPFLISPLEGLQKIGASVTYVQGCDVKCDSDSGFADAVNAAKAADVVVVVVGLDEGQERYNSYSTLQNTPILCYIVSKCTLVRVVTVMILDCLANKTSCFKLSRELSPRQHQ
jgi:hypothetical protein